MFTSLFQISLKFVPEGSIDNNPAFVQVMAWYGTGHMPLPSNQWWPHARLPYGINRPQWINMQSPINPSHKSHNASDIYPTMHHFVTEMCTHVHISVTKWCIVGYETDALWDLCNRSIRPGLNPFSMELRQQHPSDLLSGAGTSREHSSRDVHAGQQITRVLLP